METRDLAYTEQQPTASSPLPPAGGAPGPASPYEALPYEGLQQIWDLFPGSHPNSNPHRQAVVSEAAYLARAQQLVRYEEAAHAALAPAAFPVAVDRQPMVWVPGPSGGFVAVPRDTLPAGYLQPAPAPVAPRDLSPRPLFDPRAQFLAAGGVFAAGAGYGVGQILSSLAGFSSGMLIGLAALVIAIRMPMSPSARGGDTYVTHNHNKWFGRSNTTNG